MLLREDDDVAIDGLASDAGPQPTREERRTHRMKQHRNFGLFLAAAALMGCALAPASADHKVDAKGLPAGWAAAPLGNELGDDRLLVDQSVSVDDKGVWTISAGGYDLWTENDGGLIVYMKHTGDGRASF